MTHLPNLLGIIGMGCFLFAYWQLQRGRWGGQDVWYLLANLIGALLVLVSLLFHWNLPAFLLEAAWAAISMWGLVKHYRAPKT